jgi:tetratricopeptide (TPR) repeat protein
MVELHTSLATRLTAVPRLIIDYIRLSFIPVNLHMEYKLPFPKSLLQPYYFFPFILALPVVPAILLIWKKGKRDTNQRIIFFGIGWFIIALIPYLNIVFELNAVFSEHWLYIPEMGLIVSFVYAAFLYVKKHAARNCLTAFILITILSFAYITIRQNRIWKDGLTFYAYTIKHAPESAKAYNNLAGEYLKLGDVDKAVDLLKTAVKIDPLFGPAKENLQNIESALKRKQ